MLCKLCIQTFDSILKGKYLSKLTECMHNVDFIYVVYFDRYDESTHNIVHKCALIVIETFDIRFARGAVGNGHVGGWPLDPYQLHPLQEEDLFRSVSL